MKRNVWISWCVVIVVMVVSIGFLECTSKKEPEICKIGAILPLTGPVSHIGEWQKRGIELGVANANAKLQQNRRIHLLIEDSKGQAKEGIMAFNKLVNVDGASAVFSSMSSVSNSLVPLADEIKCPLIMIAVSLPEIAERSKYAFRNHPGSEDEARVMSAFLLRRQDISRMAVFYINDDFGLGAYKMFDETFTAGGGKIIWADSYEKDRFNFRTDVLKAINGKPDGIYVIGYLDATAILIKQLREAGFQGVLASNMAMSVPQYIEMVGEGFENSYFTITSFSTNSEDEMTKSFVQKYKDLTGSTPNIFAAMAYDGIGMIVEAMEKEGVKKEKIQERLLNIRYYEGVMGNLQIDEEGNIEFPLKIAEFKDGKLSFAKEQTN